MTDRSRVRNPVFIFNALILAFFLILRLAAAGYSEDASRFPKFVLAIGIGVLLLWMVIYFLFPKAMRFVEAQEEKEEDAAGEPGRFYRAWLCIGGSILLGFLLGFIWMVPAVFLGYGLILGDKSKLISLVIITVVTTLVFYIGFDYFLHIPLLTGILLDLS